MLDLDRQRCVTTALLPALGMLVLRGTDRGECGQYSQRVAVGDWNGDKLPDLAVSALLGNAIYLFTSRVQLIRWIRSLRCTSAVP